MKKPTGLLLITVFALVYAVGAIAGPTELSRNDAEKLIKGNTAEGTNIWGRKMIWYFDEFGKLKKRDDRGQKGKAAWRLDEKGRLCYQDKHMTEERCERIIPKEGGRYEVRFEAQWKWEKVVPGNPHNL
jgi:hypothetical protein